MPRDATAFWHRDKLLMLTVEANWADPGDDDANLEWAREGIAAVEDLGVGAGRYGNFPGRSEEPARLAYDENCDRLVDLKSKYDSRSRFPGLISPRPGGN